MKLCSECNTAKPEAEFYKDAGGKDGLRANCKCCVRAGIRANALANPEAIRSKNRSYYESHKGAFVLSAAAWAKSNKAKRNAIQRRRRLRNPEGTKAATKRARDKRLATAKGKLENNIRSRIVRAIRRGSKAGRRTIQLLGYTFAELKEHIEAQFVPGMSWQNYAIDGWHIDHIRPLSFFSYETPDDPEFREAWALHNLRPLWAADNLSKGAKLV